MTTETATQPLLDRYLDVRKSLTMACGDRWRVLPSWLIAVMTQRIYAVCKPAVRLLQHLIAGTYRPHKPRLTPRKPSERIPTTVPELEDRLWLFRLLPASWDSGYTAGG